MALNVYASQSPRRSVCSNRPPMADKKIRWQNVYRQFIAAAIANLAILCGGCIVTWVSSTLPQLEEQTSLSLTTAEQSWVGSLQLLGSVLGPAPAMLLLRMRGCRPVLAATAAVYVAGWALVAAMQSVAVLLLGRFVLGLAMGASFAVLPVYTGEIAQVEVRGILSSFFALFFTAGFLVEYCVGPYMSYLPLALLSGTIPLFLLVGVFFIPDTPYQLVARGHTNDARAALKWLRNASGEDVATELELIKMNVAARLESNANSSFKHLVTHRGNLKALLLCLTLNTFQQMCGSTAIATYTQTIFTAGGSYISATLSSIVNGIVMVLSSIISCMLVDLVGRRPLTFTSSAGMGLSLVSLGSYFYLKGVGDVSSFGWLPITCAIGFTIFYGIGWAIVPVAVAAEVFSSDVKERAMFVGMAYLNFVGFLNARFFLEVSEQLGMHWCFWFFGACGVVGGVFAYFCLPETKGRSHGEIQRIFHG